MIHFGHSLDEFEDWKGIERAVHFERDEIGGEGRKGIDPGDVTLEVTQNRVRRGNDSIPSEKNYSIIELAGNDPVKITPAPTID